MKDEFEWIHKITPTDYKQASVVEGIGDDAALIRPELGMNDILCVDTMVEMVHFSRKTMDPYHIGYKALAVNISDIAAMGGTPKFYLVSIAIPKTSWKEEELLEIYNGMSSIADAYQMDLIGGDTVSTEGPLVISVTVQGRVPQERKLLRKNAQPGDVVFLTGAVGRSAAGLHVLLQGEKEPSRLIEAHQQPQPQVEAGLLLAESGYRIALNDISDGLASEAHEIAEASDVHVVLEEKLLPQVEELSTFDKKQVLEWMLYGGEDFQLIGTVSEEHWPLLAKKFEEAGFVLYKVGSVEEGPANVSLETEEGRTTIFKKGYNHFK